LEAARTAGIGRVQVDLIYGLRPGVRSRSLSDEIGELVAAGATGISAYALTVEERTAFGREPARADDDAAAREYAELMDACQAAGLRQLETSNFGVDEARHNNIYWYGLPYLGLGTGAHGLTPPSSDLPFGRRYRIGDVPRSRAPGDDDLPFEDPSSSAALLAPRPEEPRTHAQYVDEGVFTFLRTPVGLPLSWLSHHTSLDAVEKMRCDARVRRGVEEGRLAFRPHPEGGEALHVEPPEKIRGDAWCALVAGLL
jgi:oxygen-independent coproporphyrinogen-3 oxidase